MSSATQNQDQKHPQEQRDRQIVNKLLQQGSNDYNLAELARLRIRYRNFPGARDIQQDLDLLLQQWNLTEEQLYEITRKLHAEDEGYLNRRSGQEQEDWS